MERATQRFGSVEQPVLGNVLGRIATVNELAGRPVGTYDVLLDDDRLLRNVPQLLPAASHAFVRGKRVQGGSGILPIAQRGDPCLVTWVVGPLGLAQPFIMGFFSPRREGSGGDQRNERRVVPGSFCLCTPFGNGLVLHNGGVVELFSEEGCKRTMTPTVPDVGVGMQSLISDLCRNYRLRTAAGELSMSEIGDGRTAYRCRINEFSPYGQSRAMRVARAAAAKGMAEFLGTGSVDGAVAAAAASDAGDSLRTERYVEIVYGSAPNGNLYEERLVGDGSVVLSCDGSGGFKRVADVSLVDEAGALRIESNFSGQRTEEGVVGSFTYAGSVQYTTAFFNVQAPISRFTGIVLIGLAGLPSARIGDLVLVGDKVGTIITGQPNLIH